MTETLSPEAFLELFRWWVGEFDAADRFYETWSQLPPSVPPDDYDWSAAATASDRLMAHPPSNGREAICLIEVLIHQIDDRPELEPPLRAVQALFAQGLLAEVVGPAPHPVVVSYASAAA